MKCHWTKLDKCPYMSCLSILDKIGQLHFCPVYFSEIILIFGQTNRDRTPSQNWTNVPICPVLSNRHRGKNSEFLDRQIGTKFLFVPGHEKNTSQYFFRVSLSQSVTSRNRQCGVSVATLVCPIYP